MTNIPYRNAKFKNSFFPNSIHLWNNLDTDIKCSKNISTFKSAILKIIRPQKKKIFKRTNSTDSKISIPGFLKTYL